MPRRRRLKRSLVSSTAIVIATLAFGLGFLLAYDRAPSAVEAAGSTDTTRPTGRPTTTALGSPTTDPGDQVDPTTTTSSPAPTTAAPTTAAPTTAAPTTGPAVASTVPATTAPTVPTTLLTPTTTLVAPTTTTAVGPAILEVIYPRNSRGEMVLLEGSQAAVFINNIGSTTGDYQVQGSGFITVGTGGVVNGTLAPGEVATVPVTAGVGVAGLPGPHGNVAVFNTGGLVTSIPVVIR